MYVAPFWCQTEILAKNNEGNAMFVYVFTQPSADYIGNYASLLNLTSSAHGSDLVFLFGPSLFQKVGNILIKNATLSPLNFQFFHNEPCKIIRSVERLKNVKVPRK